MNVNLMLRRRRSAANAGRRAYVAAAAVLAATAWTPRADAVWPTYAGNAQHTALSTVPSQALQRIVWQTPVDLHPVYTGSSLLIHYGSPLVTPGNTVLVPVKVGAADTFRVDARRASDGQLLWQVGSDYTLPPHNWVPGFGMTITPAGRLYTPAAGGQLQWVGALDTAGPHAVTRVAFYGTAAHDADAALYDASLRVCTPLTPDAQGSVYFGVRALSGNPQNIQSGLAVVDAGGAGRFVSASAATGGLATQIALNCAPALTADGTLLYVAMRGSSSSPAWLVAISTADLSTQAIAPLIDPASGLAAFVSSDGTASPMVGPDGRVYYGVLENPFGSHSVRGWLLQFDAALVPSGAPGSFGWDDTPSIVPLTCVPSYAGAAPYLLMTKYNYYAGLGSGDGTNRLAVIDPDATQIDPYSGETVMQDVLTILGPTPDADQLPAYPNAVREWCINTAAVDPFTNAVLAGSEDGKLYRWDLTTNSFTENVTLTAGLGEAYTPTVVGPDGRVYAINNATLFAVGAAASDVTLASGRSGVLLGPGLPNPFTRNATLRFTLREAGPVSLEVLDLRGRRVTRLWSGTATAGEHALHWDGRNAHGAPVAAGIYFVRLHARGTIQTRKLMRIR